MPRRGGAAVAAGRAARAFARVEVDIVGMVMSCGYVLGGLAGGVLASK